jgi:hypothetical protein
VSTIEYEQDAWHLPASEGQLALPHPDHGQRRRRGAVARYAWLLALVPPAAAALLYFGLTPLVDSLVPSPHLVDRERAGVLAIVAASVGLASALLLATLDARALRRAELDPPSIAWSVLPPTYLIARARIVARSSLGPVALSIVALVGAVVIGVGQATEVANWGALMPGMGPTIDAGASPPGDMSRDEAVALALARSLGVDAEDGVVSWWSPRATDYAYVTLACEVTDATGVATAWALAGVWRGDGHVYYQTIEGAAREWIPPRS